MSKVVKLLEIAQMDDGEEIGAVRGILKKIWPSKRGKTKGRSWSFQNGVLQQGKTELKITFCGFEDDISPKLEGKEIMILAGDEVPDKEPASVYKKTDDYNGKDDPMIHVNEGAVVQKAANVSDNDGGDDDGDGDGGGDDDDGDTLPSRGNRAASSNSEAGKFSKHEPVHGATVGNCIKLGVEVIQNIGTDPMSSAFYEQVHFVASNLIKTSLLLENGRLAKNPEDK